MIRPVRLVIFDCDGVLVDSEVLAIRTLVSALAAEGIDVSLEEAFRAFLGRSLASVSDWLEARHGRPMAPSVLEAMRGKLYDLYRTELKATAGVQDAVTGLKELGLGVCVASSSQLERIGVSLEVTGLTAFFGSQVYSASMVSRGKPAPDLFLLAAARMGVRPEECLVVEDSPAGIAAAKAAGMRVVAFTGGSHVAPAGLVSAIEGEGPDATLHDMRSLRPLVHYINRRAGGEIAPIVAAVDVGTASARAALVDLEGGMLGRAEVMIHMRREGRLRAEHKSEQIWDSVACAMRRVLTETGVDPGDVAGVAFDATCSLVMRDRNGAPLAVSPESGEDHWDTIVWLDHRAEAEAERCTATGDPALGSLGGSMFPEMQIPKIMWLKNALGPRWTEVGYLFDLADYLSWRATGSSSRSLCTLSAKWSYDSSVKGGWPERFLERLGLADLSLRAGVTGAPQPVGHPVGSLSEQSAAALGLRAGTIVAAGMVDAFAGALGALGHRAALQEGTANAVAIVAGTSTAILCLTRKPQKLPGAWGPFSDAIVPGISVMEGGQSAAGALLDHVIRHHAAGGEPTASRHQNIGHRIQMLLAEEGPDLGGRLHVIPDFLGNRSPLGDPSALGIFWGLTLESDFDSLCRMYWRTAVGLALGLRQILGHLETAGFRPDTLPIVGGHTRSPVLLQLYADAIGRAVIGPGVEDPTLLGTSMAAAAGAGIVPNLAAAAKAMHHSGKRHEPRPEFVARFQKDYEVFLALQAQRATLDNW